MASKSIIAFFGASNGCGLFALKRAIADGHTCIALCRNPAKLDDHFPHRPDNLIVNKGDAHDPDAVAGCLSNPNDPTMLVDSISFTIGGPVKVNLSMPDPDVCKKGMKTLLEALAGLRAQGASGRPLISVISTTGISKHKRDVPILLLPVYHILLKTPHADKKIMEEALAASSERWAIVKPSLLVDKKSPGTPLRVGIEDPVNGWEKVDIGYTISREDVGNWMYDNFLTKSEHGNQYERKAVAISW